MVNIYRIVIRNKTTLRLIVGTYPIFLIILITILLSVQKEKHDDEAGYRIYNTSNEIILVINSAILLMMD